MDKSLNDMLLFQIQKAIYPDVKRALILGINDYKNLPSDLNMPSLKNSVSKAHSIHKFLSESGFSPENIKTNLIIDQSESGNVKAGDVNSEDVTNILKEYLKEAEHMDEGKYAHYFIYFSGHGVISKDGG